MANLLAIPARWLFTVPGGNPGWNGSSFSLINSAGTNVVFNMGPAAGISDPSPGDTFTGQASTTFTTTATFLNLISASNVVLQSIALTSTPQFFTWDAYAAGPGAKFILTASAGSAAAATINDQDLLLTPDEVTNYNCQCDDDGPIVTDTLANLRRRLYVRLGRAAMPTYPPGMAEELDDFLRSAQIMLYNRYAAVRVRRWFTWQLLQGVRFYDLEANRGLCTLKLDGRRIEWAGVSDGDSTWTPITCGINPAGYGTNIAGIVCAYEVRQCIEVWPPPSDSSWLLRIKGDVGMLPFVADTDRCSIDAEPLFLLALANAKAHYKHDDAGNYSSQAQTMMRDLTAASHGTRRYIPGGKPLANQTMPKRV